MAEEFEGIAVGPVGVIQLEEAAAPGCAGIVHENVEVAEFPAGGVDQRLLGVPAGGESCRDC